MSTLHFILLICSPLLLAMACVGVLIVVRKRAHRAEARRKAADMVQASAIGGGGGGPTEPA